MALQNNWWSKRDDGGQSLSNRIAQINKINDPTTNADEILRYGKWLLYLLLAFTGLLGGLSYYKNFVNSFGHEAALFMAAALTIVIEVGKNYTGKWALRIPFFRGFGHIGAKPENTFVWVGLLSISSATFYMSVHNSTTGAEQLSTMLHHERHQSKFQPDTKAIDAQITDTQKSMSENQGIKWKGTTTYTAQKAIAKQSSALENLQNQRAASIAQQRADWERSEAIKSQNGSYAANLVMASGGWVELLQALVILLLVSCEKSLDKSLPGQPATQSRQEIGFKSAAPAMANYHEQPEPEQRRPIGFHRSLIPVPAPVPIKNTVEQCTTAEQQEQSAKHSAGTAGILADVRWWEKRANQCFERVYSQNRQEKRDDNRRRVELYCAMLHAVGVGINISFEDKTLEFLKPDTYNVSDEAAEAIKIYKSEFEKRGWAV